MPDMNLATNFTTPNLRILGFEDQFNGTSGAVGVAPTGQTWESSSSTGVAHPLVMSNGVASRGTGGTAARTAWVLNGGDSDGTLTGKIGAIGDATHQLIARVGDADNYIALVARVSGSDKKYALQARIAGDSSQLASSTGGTASASGDIPRLELNYDKISAYVGGTLLFGGTRDCPAPLLYNTRHGLLLQSASSGAETWDYIQFVSPA